MTKVKLVSILLGCIGILFGVNGIAAGPVIGGGYLKNGFNPTSGVTIKTFAIAVHALPSVCVQALNKKWGPGTYSLDFKCPKASQPMWANGLIAITPCANPQSYSCPVTGSAQWTYQPNATGRVIYTLYPTGQANQTIKCQVSFK